MALKYLGDSVDIHTGGIDHIPVHHTNEIAQSEAATGKRFANYWLHSNFLLTDGTKISKSLGNGYTLSDLLENSFTPQDFRMFVLQSHYRSESNFTWDNLASAAARLKHWKSVACLRHQLPDNADADSEGQKISKDSLAIAKRTALDMMNSDLSSPRAVLRFEQALDSVDNDDLAHVSKDEFDQLLITIDDLMGFDLLASTPDIGDDTKQLISERFSARKSKDWVRSDQLRDELASNGVGVNDTPKGTHWFYL